MAQSLRINHDISSLDDYVSIQNDHRHLCEPVTLRQDELCGNLGDGVI